MLREIRELARQHSEYAIQRLREMLDDPDGRIVCAAASQLLDRAWGKPEVAISADVTVTPAIDTDALRESLVARLVAMASTATVEAEVVEVPALPAPCGNVPLSAQEPEPGAHAAEVDV